MLGESFGGYTLPPSCGRRGVGQLLSYTMYVFVFVLQPESSSEGIWLIRFWGHLPQLPSKSNAKFPILDSVTIIACSYQWDEGLPCYGSYSTGSVTSWTRVYHATVVCVPGFSYQGLPTVVRVPGFSYQGDTPDNTGIHNKQQSKEGCYYY
jgi:hypothetical protein